MSRIPLGALGEFKNGINFKSERMGRGIRLINVKDITSSHRLDPNKLDLVDVDVDEELFARPNDLFFVRSSVKLNGIALVGKIKSEEPKSVHCGFVIRFRPNSHRISTEYLLYLLRTPEFRERLKGLSSGAAIVNISQAALAGLCVPLPSLRDQEAISAVLSSYDDLIENNSRRIQLLEESTRQLYRAWFVRLRFPGHEHTKVINGVPSGWQRTILENALVLQRGFDLPIHEREDGEIPVYGSTGIVGSHSKAMVDGPGVVTGRSGTLGDVHLILVDFWPLNTALWIRDFKKVSAYYAAHLLREMDLKQYNAGASVPTLDRKAVHRINVLIPPPRLMDAFDGFAKPAFQQVAILDAQNQKLRAARDLLLPRLMSGDYHLAMKAAAP